MIWVGVTMSVWLKISAGDKVYLGTSVLLPLLDGDDHDHVAVTKALTHIVEIQATLVTSSYTLVEAGALVKRRLGAAVFQAFGETIDQSAEVIWVDEDLHRRAWTKAAKESRRGPSLVDWVGFLVMKDLGVHSALAIDDHFRRQGFRTLPYAHP